MKKRRNSRLFSQTEATDEFMPRKRKGGQFDQPIGVIAIDVNAIVSIRHPTLTGDELLEFNPYLNQILTLIGDSLNQYRAMMPTLSMFQFVILAPKAMEGQIEIDSSSDKRYDIKIQIQKLFEIISKNVLNHYFHKDHIVWCERDEHGLQVNINEIKHRYEFANEKNILALVKNPNAVEIAQFNGLIAIEMHHECHLDEGDMQVLQKKIKTLPEGSLVESFTDLDATMVNNSLTRYTGELVVNTVLAEILKNFPAHLHHDIHIITSRMSPANIEQVLQEQSKQNVFIYNIANQLELSEVKSACQSIQGLLKSLLLMPLMDYKDNPDNYQKPGEQVQQKINATLKNLENATNLEAQTKQSIFNYLNLSYELISKIVNVTTELKQSYNEIKSAGIHVIERLSVQYGLVAKMNPLSYTSGQCNKIIRILDKYERQFKIEKKSLNVTAVFFDDNSDEIKAALKKKEDLGRMGVTLLVVKSHGPGKIKNNGHQDMFQFILSTYRSAISSSESGQSKRVKSDEVAGDEFAEIDCQVIPKNFNF